MHNKINSNDYCGPARQRHWLGTWLLALLLSLPAWAQATDWQVTFVDRGDIIKIERVADGANATPPRVAFREGHRFLGWDGNTSAIRQDTTLNARWITNFYSVVFNTAGGERLRPVHRQFDTLIGELPTPVRAGYTFAGWQGSLPERMPARTVSLTATWQGGASLTFDTAGGNALAPISQAAGTAVRAPRPFRMGYAFTGWTPAVPATMPATSQHFTAGWVANFYSVILDSNGGSRLRPVHRRFNDPIGELPTPTRPGYTFIGWQPELPATMPAQTFRVSAQWQPLAQAVTLQFDTQGGSSLSAITAIPGTPLSAPQPPRRQGHSFRGWQPDFPATMPATDTTLQADWITNFYSVIPNNPGGERMRPVHFAFNDPIEAPTPPSRDGFIFAGWQPELPETMPAFNLTVQSTWLPVSEAAVRINEIMASNGNTLADEDGNFEDWIELYNPANQAIDLTGWGLTDNASRPFKWQFPAGSRIGANSYLLVWASGKDRATPQLHTNYGISAGGEDIVLTAPDGTTIDRFDAIAIPRDVSYGRARANPEQLVFFSQPTPNALNADASGELLFSEVSFSEPSRLFENSLTVSLTSSDPAHSIVYTLDRSEPSASSTPYTGPIVLNSTQTLRARTLAANGALGHIQSEHYIAASADVITMASHLPVVVMDAFGATPAQLNTRTTVLGTPRVPAHFMSFESAIPFNMLNDQPFHSSFQGLRYRGSSSRTFPKKPFSVELQNQFGSGVDIPILGMAADEDWVMYAGYQYDRAGIRNTLMYNLSRQIGRWAPDSRLAEVYLNQDGATLIDTDYQGYYAFIEAIRPAPHRLNIELVYEVHPDADLIDPLAPGDWTGGFILKVDRVGRDEYRLSSELIDRYYRETFNNSATVGLAIDRPKLRNLDGAPYNSVAEARLTSKQAAYIQNYIDTFDRMLLQEWQNGFSTRNYRQYIDISSFVDHFVLNLFSQNPDGLRLSSYFHKPKNQPLHAGPIWDFDRALGAESRSIPWAQWDTAQNIPFCSIHWWRYLCDDPDFMQQVYDRIDELAQTILHPDNLAEQISQITAPLVADEGIGSAVSRNFAKWSQRPPLGGSFDTEVTNLVDWTVNRSNWLQHRHVSGDNLPLPPELTISGDAGSGWRIRGSLAAGQQGEVYLALAQDPRMPNGSIHPAASPDFIQTQQPLAVMARVRHNNRWSAPARLAASDYPGLDVAPPPGSFSGIAVPTEPRHFTAMGPGPAGWFIAEASSGATQAFDAPLSAPGWGRFSFDSLTRGYGDNKLEQCIAINDNDPLAISLSAMLAAEQYASGLAIRVNPNFYADLASCQEAQQGISQNRLAGGRANDDINIALSDTAFNQWQAFTPDNEPGLAYSVADIPVGSRYVNLSVRARNRSGNDSLTLWLTAIGLSQDSGQNLLDNSHFNQQQLANGASLNERLGQWQLLLSGERSGHYLAAGNAEQALTAGQWLYFDGLTTGFGDSKLEACIAVPAGDWQPQVQARAQDADNNLSVRLDISFYSDNQCQIDAGISSLRDDLALAGSSNWQSLQLPRQTAGSINAPFALMSIRGRDRGDGSAIPRLYLDNLQLSASEQ